MVIGVPTRPSSVGPAGPRASDVSAVEVRRLPMAMPATGISTGLPMNAAGPLAGPIRALGGPVSARLPEVQEETVVLTIGLGLCLVSLADPHVLTGPVTTTLKMRRLLPIRPAGLVIIAVPPTGATVLVVLRPVVAPV